jgi:hypothetical protein
MAKKMTMAKFEKSAKDKKMDKKTGEGKADKKADKKAVAKLNKKK